MAKHSIKETLAIVSESIGGGVHTTLNAKQDICRVSVLPVASVDYKNVLYQYIGPTTREYIHNYYYECALDGNSYVWVRRDVQPTFNRKTLVPIPMVTTGEWSYSGEPQGPTIKGLEVPRVNVVNETATDAGDYTMSVSLKDMNTTVWEDGSKDAKTWDYSITKITQTISASTNAIEFDNDHLSFNINVTGVITSLSASINDDSVATITSTNDKVTLNATGNKGSTTVTLYAVGDTNYTASQVIEIPVTTNYRIVTKGFGEATDAELVAMVEAADRGEIDLYEDAGWRVGDERTVHLSAMAATGVGESHAEQDVTLVLMNRGGYTLSSATESGRNICSFVVGLKIMLGKNIERGYMNSTDTNNGSWKNSARRAWCNSVFYNAIPQSIRSIFKQVKVVTAQTYNGTINEETDDYFFLPALKEWLGIQGYSNATEAATLSQWEYYNGRTGIKELFGSWSRSPSYNNKYAFCYLATTSGTSGYDSANKTKNIAPVGCI